MAKFYNKNIKNTIKRIAQREKIQNNRIISEISTQKDNVADLENNIEVKNNEDMNTYEKIQMANSILNTEEITPKYKRVKKDKGLIERTESSKIVLTEDNKELLND